MERFTRGGLPVNEAKKRNPVLVSMPVAALTEHATMQCVQSSEQRGCSMPLVVVRPGFAAGFFSSADQGLPMVQRLDLRHFIHRVDVI